MHTTNHARYDDDTGKTLHNYVAVNNFHIDFPTDYPVQIVSPFLTGRVYHGNGDYSDDRIASYDDIPSSNESDYFTNSSFFVNDPSNTFSFGAGNTPNHGDFPALSDVQWGFNDLERRKKHLCILLKRNCTITDLGNGNSTTLDLLGNMLHIPLAIGAH